MHHSPHTRLLLAAAIALLGAIARQASAVDYLQIDPTGSPGNANYPVSGGFGAFGINDAGLVVGTNNFNGLLWSGGSMLGIRVVDGVNGVRYSEASGIANSAGGNTIVGSYADNNWGRHGFVLTGWSPSGFDPGLGLPAITGTFTLLDVPGATFTGASGINDSQIIVGNTLDPRTGGSGGFVFNGSGYTIFGIAGANSTEATDVNNANVVVGTYHDNAGYHGYVAALAGISGDQIATFTTIDVPVSGTQITHLTGINDAGDLTGWYQDAGGRQHGFFMAGGTFTGLDYSGLNPANFLFRDTLAFGVNASDEVVGQTAESVNFNGVIGGHAFLATGLAVPEPGTLTLALLLVPAALAARRRPSR